MASERLSDAEYERIRSTPCKDRTPAESRAYYAERGKRKWEEREQEYREEQDKIDHELQLEREQVVQAVQGARDYLSQTDALGVFATLGALPRRVLTAWTETRAQDAEIATALDISTAKCRRILNSLRALCLIVPDWPQDRIDAWCFEDELGDVYDFAEVFMLDRHADDEEYFAWEAPTLDEVVTKGRELFGEVLNSKLTEEASNADQA